MDRQGNRFREQILNRCIPGQYNYFYIIEEFSTLKKIHLEGGGQKQNKLKSSFIYTCVYISPMSFIFKHLLTRLYDNRLHGIGDDLLCTHPIYTLSVIIIIVICLRSCERLITISTDLWHRELVKPFIFINHSFDQTFISFFKFRTFLFTLYL